MELKDLKVILVTLLISLMIIGIAIATFLIRRPPQTRTKASEQSISAFLLPPSVNEKEGISFTLNPKAISEKEATPGSILLTVKYDQEHLILSKIKKDFSENNFRLLKSSSIKDANLTGKIKLLFGATSKEGTSSATINLAPITFSIQSEGRSKIFILPEESQVVFIDQQIGTIQTNDGVDVNSSGEITPTSPQPIIED